MESPSENYQQHQQPGAQNEPFFDLLQQGVTTASSSNYNNIAKRMESAGDDVLPSFDFQPIRTSVPTSVNNSGSSSSAGRIEENRGRQGSPPVSYTTFEPMVRRSREPPPTYDSPVSRSQEHEKESFDSATAVAVERTMKKYADNLLRVLEGMTVRLSQLESSTQHLENLFEGIMKVALDNHGEADGKLRSLERHILEVQRGVQVLRDRQEIFEAQSQLAKLQLTSKAELVPQRSAVSAPAPSSEPPAQLGLGSPGKAPLETPRQQVAETPSASYYQPQLQQMPLLPGPPPLQPQSQLPPQQPQLQQHVQVPQPQRQHQAPQQKQEVHVQEQSLQQPMHLQQPSVPHNEVSPQPYQQQPLPPPAQQLPHPSQLPPAPYPQQQQQQQQQQPSQPPPLPNYPHPSEVPSYNPHGQVSHPGPHHIPLPSLSYSSDLPNYHPSYGSSRPSMPSQIPSGPQQQQLHNVGMYDSSTGRNISGQLSLPAPYLQQGHPSSGPSPYEVQGLNPGNGYPGTSYRVAQQVPSASSGGSGGYPRLPLAQAVPHALPTGGGSSGTTLSGGPPSSSNRVRIDEVIDKVAAMGFSKDQVRAAVHRLTESNQPVDLNIVLDKLMNGESAQASAKGWFGR